MWTDNLEYKKVQEIDTYNLWFGIWEGNGIPFVKGSYVHLRELLICIYLLIIFFI